MTIILKNKETLHFKEFIFKCCIGKNGLTKPKIKKANMMFKRYGGRNLQFEIIQDFDNEPIIRKKKLVRSK